MWLMIFAFGVKFDGKHKRQQRKYINNINNMQVQKHLFRIAERANRSESAPTCWGIIYITTFILTLIFTIIFVCGQLFVKPHNHMLRDCYSRDSYPLKVDEIGIIYEDYETMKEYLTTISTNELKPFKNNSYCDVYKNINDTILTDKAKLQFVMEVNVLALDHQSRQEMLFNNYTIILKQINPFSEFFYGLNNLLTIELLQMNNQQDKYIQISADNLRVKWIGEDETTILQKVQALGEIIIAYGVSSVATSLYIYATIIASPSVILLFLRCTRFGRNQNFLQISKVFPWIGMHSLIRQSASNQHVKNNIDDICRSFLCYFGIIYLIYYLIISHINVLFFDVLAEEGVKETFFGYLAIVEFSALIFMRTRPFIRHYPVANSLSIFLFLLYIKFTLYGFKLYAILIVYSFGVCLFSWMMLKLQIPAQTTWDATQNYVPTLERPRVGMLPVFNLNWISSLPEEWTSLVPLFGRGNFNERQLRFVDQKYEELNQVLNE